MRTYKDLTGDGGSDVLGQVVAQRERLASRLMSVKRLVAVMSGKGGVGKSSVAAGLAAALAARGDRVALLDADLNGPSLPRILGLPTASPRLLVEGMAPVEGPFGVAVMSTGFFLEQQAQPMRYEGPAADAFTWRGTAEATTLRELLANTAWGERDWLFVDMPPGSERLPNVLALLPGLAGAVVVTLGSAVSLGVVARSVTAARERGVRMLGLVENMAGARCASCGELTPLFSRRGAACGAAEAMGLPFLGEIPFEHEVAARLEEGRPMILSRDEPVFAAHDALATALRRELP
jgi:ATP-binding protein involved in chromosome partitioning